MSLRLEKAQSSALVLGKYLQGCARISNVRYPGLEAHPQHALAKSQVKGFSSLVSFEIDGGADAALRLCEGTGLIRHATSLGAVESTMERRGAQPGQEHLPAGSFV